MYDEKTHLIARVIQLMPATAGTKAAVETSRGLSLIGVIAWGVVKETYYRGPWSSCGRSDHRQCEIVDRDTIVQALIIEGAFGRLVPAETECDGFLCILEPHEIIGLSEDMEGLMKVKRDWGFTQAE